MPARKYDRLPTKAAKIRAMLADGLSRSEIAKALGIRYQHVRNVEVQNTRRGNNEIAAAPSRRAADLVELRVPSTVKEIIEHAAHLSGRSMSDFIIANSFEAATTAIERIGRLALSARDARQFAEALVNPPEPNARLRELMYKDAPPSLDD